MGKEIDYSNELQPTTDDNEKELLGKILTVLLGGSVVIGGGIAPYAFVSNMVGTVLDYAGDEAPPGFLLCHGQLISRANYGALFAKIGTTFGAGDGTSFGLPDLRGRVVAGKDNMGGASADRLTNASGAGVNGDALGAAGGSESLSTNDAAQSGSDSVSLTTDNNVQPTFILNKIIFTGV
jgi:microcystin-dependent protein